MKGVGGVCEMCMCLARGGVGAEEGKWIKQGLELGFTNPVGAGVLDVCLYLGCGGCCLPRPGPSSSQSRFPLSR